MIVFEPPQQHPFRQRRVVLMSGLSDPTTCQLSESQEAFLRQLETDPDEIVWANFPYLLTHTADRRQTSLWKASLRNGHQFLIARKNPYKAAAQLHWQTLLESCHEVVVITLSCGLEIFNVVESSCSRPGKLTVIALGPVARNRPRGRHILVRGRRDLVSLPFFPQADVMLPKVGHMNYLECSRTRELVQSYL